MAETTTTIRLNDEDQKALAEIKKRTGIVSTTQIIRFSLRTALRALDFVGRTTKKARPRRNP